jgi:hypothetical protein
MEKEIKTVYDLKRHVAATGSHYFDRSSMKFFGDTLKNFGIRKKTIMNRRDRKTYLVWELYRKRPVKRGLKNSAYFDCETFQRRFALYEI